MDKDIQLDSNGSMLWNKVEPPYWWSKYNRYILAERFDDYGMPEYIVYGNVEEYTVLGNAHIYSWDYQHLVEFAEQEEGFVHRWYREGE